MENNVTENTKKKDNKTKKIKNKKRAEEKSAQDNDDFFNFDNEIVIGVTKIPDPTTNTKQKKSKPKKVNKKQKKEKTKKEQKNNKKVTKKNEIKTNKKSKIMKGILKWTILLIALFMAIIFFLMSPLFNIVQIQVLGNEKISKETIISLSKIQIGENIFKTSSTKIRKNIKENAYIDEVETKRSLPNIIILNIKERKVTFMLEYASSYAYINNQGYILEITKEQKEVPIITGYTTPEENIEVGKRLCSEDLERLQKVLQIVESANGNGIANLINRINIQDKQNYTLTMEEGKKTVYLGDASNLSSRIPYLKAILIGEEGIEGEIFVNGDLNKQNAFFRKKE